MLSFIPLIIYSFTFSIFLYYCCLCAVVTTELILWRSIKAYLNHQRFPLIQVMEWSKTLESIILKSMSLLCNYNRRKCVMWTRILIYQTEAHIKHYRSGCMTSCGQFWYCIFLDFCFSLQLFVNLVSNLNPCYMKYLWLNKQQLK